jgi:hypothetical protein
MRELEFSAEVGRELDRERFEHPHPEVRRRMRVVWTWSQDFSQRNCARVGGVSERTVRRYLDAFQEGGLERLRELLLNVNYSCLVSDNYPYPTIPTNLPFVPYESRPSA